MSNLWNLAPAIYLVDAVTRVESLGHDVSDFLHSIDLTREALAEPGKYVTDQQYYAIIAHCVEDLGVPEVGFIQPESIRLLDTGMAGIATFTSDTFGKLLEVCVRYQNLLATPIKMELERTGSLLKIVLGDLQHKAEFPVDWHRVWAVETCMSSIFVTMAAEGLTGYIKHIKFSYPEPKHIQIYKEAFDCPIYFDQPRYECALSRIASSLPLKTANPLAHAFALRQCENSVSKLASKLDLVSQIEGIIIASGQQLPTLAVIAERLNMSERTLQRRIASLGTSFRVITNHVRHSMATQLLLETDLSIKEITYMLGYTETANFSLAFKSISGISPQHFRQSNQASA